LGVDVEQSTKLFLMLAFLFIVFTTMNGHLEKYVRIIFGSAGNNGKANSALGQIGTYSIPSF